MFFEYYKIQQTDLEKGVSRKVLAHSSNIMSVEVTFKRGSVGELHSHMNEQISYVIKGKFKVTIEGKEKILSKGDTYYTAPNEKHGVVALEDGILLDVFTPDRKDFLK